MPKYRVVDGHKKIGGKLYAPGDIVDVSSETAKQLRLAPVIEDDKKKKEDKDKEKK